MWHFYLDFEDFEAALAFEADFDVIGVDLHVFGNDGDKLLLQLRQVVRRGFPADTFMRKDDLQAFFGYVGRSFFLPEQK